MSSITYLWKIQHEIRKTYSSPQLIENFNVRSMNKLPNYDQNWHTHVNTTTSGTPSPSVGTKAKILEDNLNDNDGEKVPIKDQDIVLTKNWEEYADILQIQGELENFADGLWIIKEKGHNCQHESLRVVSLIWRERRWVRPKLYQCVTVCGLINNPRCLLDVWVQCERKPWLCDEMEIEMTVVSPAPLHYIDVHKRPDVEKWKTSEKVAFGDQELIWQWHIRSIRSKGGTSWHQGHLGAVHQ